MKLVIVGKGRMGSMLCETAADQGHEVLANVDKLDGRPIPDADVIIDFSHPDNVEWVLEQTKGIPYVCGTTGLQPRHQALLQEAAASRAVFYAANYSLGIALLSRLLKEAMPVLAGRFDVEIVETHHNRKADAPSGTALLLADSLDPDGKYTRVFGRQGQALREKDEIGIHALRGGTVAGTHEVHFFGPDESLTLTHQADSRQIFVNGALQAAAFMHGRRPGLYSMEDLVAV